MRPVRPPPPPGTPAEPAHPAAMRRTARRGLGEPGAGQDAAHPGDVELLPGMRRRPAARSLPPTSSPASSIPAACIGLLTERGNMGSSAWPARSSTCPSLSNSSNEPLCCDSANPDRTTSARTGSATAAHPQHDAGLPGASGAAGPAQQRRRPLHQFGVAGDRAAPGERSGVLHTDPQVAACGQRGEQHRQRRPADPVADQVAPAGSAATAATRVAASPGIPPGTPMTRSQCT